MIFLKKILSVSTAEDDDDDDEATDVFSVSIFSLCNVVDDIDDAFGEKGAIKASLPSKLLHITTAQVARNAVDTLRIMVVPK